MSTGKNTAIFRKRHFRKIGSTQNKPELTSSCCESYINKFLSTRNSSMEIFYKTTFLFQCFEGSGHEDVLAELDCGYQKNFSPASIMSNGQGLAKAVWLKDTAGGGALQIFLAKMTPPPAGCRLSPSLMLCVRASHQ